MSTLKPKAEKRSARRLGESKADVRVIAMQASVRIAMMVMKMYRQKIKWPHAYLYEMKG